MFGSSIASVRAHSTWMDVNANNVANVNTDKFKSVDTRLENNGNENPTPVLRENESKSAEDRSNTDLAKELTDQIPIEKGLAVNVKAIKTQDEMLGTLMDIKS